MMRPILRLAAFAAIAMASLAGPAKALEPIAITADSPRIEVTGLEAVDFYENRGDTLQVDATLGAGGGAGRMSVRAVTPGTDPRWIVFALTNGTDRSIERWVTAERYNAIGSGAIWPDLDASRIAAMTPSIGFVPERVKNDRADVFRVTIEPGQTITYVVELASSRVPRLYLWKPIDYELKIRDRQLFNGIMLGLTGLLAIFLTVIFAANHKMIFPAAALVCWCVLAYLCADFGFFHKLFQLRPEDNAVYRAATEAGVAASLVIFLYAFLRLALMGALVRMLLLVWIAAQLALVALAVIDPRLAATFARLSFLLVGGVGAAFVVYLALRDQDRALSLVPTWILFLVWTFGAAVALSGRLSGDIVVSGLVAGLVLVVLLIGFTVTQFAFRSREQVYGGTPSETELRSLAVDSAGCGVWEWSGRRDEIKVSPMIEGVLALHAGELNTKVADFLKHLHPSDHERFRLMLWSIQERAGGRIRTEFRMRHADKSYRWFELEASSVPGADPRALRCVGLLREITDAKLSRERLLVDAVNDALTGLPNRALFLDRLGNALQRAKTDPQSKPTVFFLDIDRFRGVNKMVGMRTADSLLKMTARRLQSHAGPQDTLARVGADQFAMLIPAEQSARDIAAMAERIRRSLRAPMKIEGQEIVLTGSIGIAVYDRESQANELMKEAEIAMFRAKRQGSDRIELFRPDMRVDLDDRVKVEAELRKAIEGGKISVFYHPIIYLSTEELVGFETTLRWNHPKLGSSSPDTVTSLSDDPDLSIKLGSFTIKRALQEAAKWNGDGGQADDRLFVSLNLDKHQFFRADLAQDIRQHLGRTTLPRDVLAFEIAESVVMENPEQSMDALELLNDAGARLALEGFGACYSSLAYLQRLPFDTLKIDRSIVQASAGGDHAGSAMVRSMVALAHELGKKIVAEGVEALEDIGFLRSVGCDYGQGLLYGDPIPEDEVLDFIKLVRSHERKRRPSNFFRPKSKRRKAETSAPPPDAPVARPAAARNGARPKPGEGAPPPAVPVAEPSRRAPAAARRAQQPPPSLAGRPSNGQAAPPNGARTNGGTVQRPAAAPSANGSSPSPPARHGQGRAHPAFSNIPPNGGSDAQPRRFPPQPPPTPRAPFGRSVVVPKPDLRGVKYLPFAAPAQPGPQPPPPPQAAQPVSAPPPIAPDPADDMTLPRIVASPSATPQRSKPVTSGLPPAIAESLKRLAGDITAPPPTRPRKTGGGS